MLTRIKIRLGINDDAQDDLLNEFITSTCDVISLRVGVITFPKVLESIAVETVISAYNRRGSEGASSEAVDVISTSYITNLLEPYAEQLENFKKGLTQGTEDATGTGRSGVRFF